MENLKAPSRQQQTGSSPNLTLEAAQAAKVLLGCYRNGDANDPDIYVRAVAAVLGEYPSEVIKDVCDPRFGLPAKSKWLPTVSEVKQACEDAMVPIDRRQREQEAIEQRKRALAAPVLPRPTYEELKEKYGPNWGLSCDDDGSPAPRSLDDMCKEAGISREDFEAINDNAAKNHAAFLAAHPEWRK